MCLNSVAMLDQWLSKKWTARAGNPERSLPTVRCRLEPRASWGRRPQIGRVEPQK